MPRWLHRTTKQLLTSVASADLPEAQANYIEEPDLSPVAGVSSIYWTITGDIVSEMSQGEKDAVDAAALTARRDSAVDRAVDDLEGDLRQLVKLMISEINILRAQHSLADRTIAQFKAQIRSGYGS